MLLFWLISILLISVTFDTYLANIVFSCDLAFKVCHQSGAQIGQLSYNLLLPWFLRSGEVRETQGMQKYQGAKFNKNAKKKFELSDAGCVW